MNLGSNDFNLRHMSATVVPPLLVCKKTLVNCNAFSCNTVSLSDGLKVSGTLQGCATTYTYPTATRYLHRHPSPTPTATRDSYATPTVSAYTSTDADTSPLHGNYSFTVGTSSIVPGTAGSATTG